jgi:three-Cys-motif partner protein
MARPSETIWEIEEHTKAKHRILRGYLGAWLPIMSKNNGRLVYIDGFAGPGVYAGGAPGSPIIALNSFLEHRSRSLITSELVYVFIDADRERINRLRTEVQKLGELPSNLKIDISCGTYEQNFGDTLDHLEKNSKKLAPTFAFIDPFGYAQATMKLSGRFLQFDRCEVLIYVPLPFIARFVSDPNQKLGETFTTFFGTDGWKTAGEKHGDERSLILHDLFRDQLKLECGLKFVKSFEIVTPHKNTGYHLFFGTNHELGLQKMKESMWRVDQLEGHKFADSTLHEQMVLFQAAPDTKPLGRALMDHFNADVFSIEEAERYTLIQTPFLPSHVKTRTLKPSDQAGKLEIVQSKPGRRPGTYPVGTQMRFRN